MVSTHVLVPPVKMRTMRRSTDPELASFVELSRARAAAHAERIIGVFFLSLEVTHKPEGACR